MTPPVRRGAFVGFGAVAEHGHLPGWRADERFAIVAVAEPRAARREAAVRALPGARLYGSSDELFAREELDFVDVVSPPACHADAIVAAAARRLHVLCEKPLVTNPADFRRARAAAAAAGVVLHPVHNWKHAEAFRLLRDAVPQPEEIVLRVERNGWSVSADDWRAERRLAGGGILVDHGWHAFYLALAFAGAEPRSVRATTDNRRYRAADVEDSARCEIGFDGCRATIELSWAGRVRETAWTLAGAGVSAEVRDAALIRRVDGGETVQPLGSSLSEGSHHADWFPGVIDSFAAAIADPAAAAAGLREAAWCVALLDAAYASAAGGGAPTRVVPLLP